MSKLIKVVMILAVAAVVIAAKQVASSGSDMDALATAPQASVSPTDITHRAGPLPERVIDNLF